MAMGSVHGSHGLGSCPSLPGLTIFNRDLHLPGSSTMGALTDAAPRVGPSAGHAPAALTDAVHE
eukprot:2240039-Karenia_brevis.AAC.1